MNFINDAPAEAGLAFLRYVFTMWNVIMKYIFVILGASPETFEDGTVMELIEQINPYFAAVGSTLLVLFFLWGICAESYDLRDRLDLWSVLKMFLKLSFGSFLLTNSLKIMVAIFTCAGNFVKLINRGTMPAMEINEDIVNTAMDMSFFSGMIFLILAIIIGVLVIVCCGIIIWTVYFRFVKIYAMLPFGSIALSTFASGSPATAGIATAYSKYFFSLVMEILAIVVSITICTALVNSGMPFLNSIFAEIFETASAGATDGGAWLNVVGYLFQMIMTIALTVGSVKGAQTLSQRMLGL